MILGPEIERRIRQLLDDDSKKWLHPVIRKHHFLPLYHGWTDTLGLRPNGTFVRWHQEAEGQPLAPLGDPFWQRFALCQGAKLYPELTVLIPDRPPGAIDCEPCGGSGEIGVLPTVICECGGVGWRLPGEPSEPSPG